MKHGLDMVINKLFSRKLMVWVTATAFMFLESGLTSEDWVAISLAYIGLEGLGDIAARWKHGS